MDKLLFINKILSLILRVVNRKIKDSYQFMRILQRMRVPFDVTYSGTDVIQLNVAGSLVLYENTSTGNIKAWLSFKASSNLITRSDDCLESDLLTIDRVRLFCEQYHERASHLSDEQQ